MLIIDPNIAYNKGKYMPTVYILSNMLRRKCNIVELYGEICKLVNEQYNRYCNATTAKLLAKHLVTEDVFNKAINDILPNLSDLDKPNKTINKDLQVLINDILVSNREHLDIVLVSISFANSLPLGICIARQIKEYSNESKVVFGGSYFIALGQDIVETIVKKYESIDIISYTYAEINLKKILMHYEQGLAVTSIPGIAVNDATSPVWQSPAEIARVAISDVKGDRSVPLLCGYGCYWGKCAYCNYVASKILRYKKVEEVVREVAELGNSDCSHIHITTECIPQKMMYDLCDGLIRGSNRIPISTFFRAEYADEQLYVKMKKAGIEYVSLGIESYSDNILLKMKKGTTRKSIKHTIDNLVKHNIEYHINLIYDYPGMMKSDMEANITGLLESAETASKVFLSKFQLYPNTDMALRPGVYGLHNLQRDGAEISIGFEREQHYGNSQYKRELRNIKHYIDNRDRIQINLGNMIDGRTYYSIEPAMGEYDEKTSTYYTIINDIVRKIIIPNKVYKHINKGYIDYGEYCSSEVICAMSLLAFGVIQSSDAPESFGTCETFLRVVSSLRQPSEVARLV